MPSTVSSRGNIKVYVHLIGSIKIYLNGDHLPIKIYLNGNQRTLKNVLMGFGNVWNAKKAAEGSNDICAPTASSAMNCFISPLHGSHMCTSDHFSSVAARTNGNAWFNWYW